MSLLSDADITVERHERVCADLDSAGGVYILRFGNLNVRVPEDKGDLLGAQLLYLQRGRDIEVAS